MELVEVKFNGKVKLTNDPYDYDVYIGSDPLTLLLQNFEGKDVEIIVRSK